MVETDAPPRNGRQHAAAALRQWIAAGTLVPGDELPSERAIAAEVGVPRHSVRVALQQLTEEGRLVARGRNRIVSAAGDASGGSLVRDGLVVLSSLAPDRRVATEGGWSRQLMAGALAELDARIGEGYGSFLVLHRPRIGRDDAARLAAERPRGVLVLDPHEGGEEQDAVLRCLRTAGIPTVIYGSPERFPQADCVWSDHAAGAAALTRWLLERGVERPRLVMPTPPDRRARWMRERLAGHAAAMAEAGRTALPELACDTRLDHVAHDAEGHDQLARRLAGELVELLTAAEPPDALLALSDRPALALIAACRLFRNLERPPLITGYDHYYRDLPEHRWVGAGPAATIDKRNGELGRELVRLLARRLTGALPPEPQHVVLEPRLVAFDEQEHP